MGREDTENACQHLTVLPDEGTPKPVGLISIRGRVREFPPRDRLARNGRERCRLSMDVDRMIGPGQVSQCCRSAFASCRIFQCGSAKEVLNLQQQGCPIEQPVISHDYGTLRVVSSAPAPRKASLEENLLFGSRGGGTHSYEGEW